MRSWPFIIPVLVILLDRITKQLIEARVRDWDIIPVIPGLFQIVHTRNTGIAFGLFSEAGSNGGNSVLIVFSFAVMIFVGWMLWTAARTLSEHWTLPAALALVLGGAAGNLYDRIAFGSVTDFLDFFWGTHHFPVFNVADSAITIGAFLLLWNLWAVRRPAEAHHSDSTVPPAPSG